MPLALKALFWMILGVAFLVWSGAVYLYLQGASSPWQSQGRNLRRTPTTPPSQLTQTPTANQGSLVSFTVSGKFKGTSEDKKAWWIMQAQADPPEYLWGDYSTYLPVPDARTKFYQRLVTGELVELTSVPTVQENQKLELKLSYYDQGAQTTDDWLSQVVLLPD